MAELLEGGARSKADEVVVMTASVGQYWHASLVVVVETRSRAASDASLAGVGYHSCPPSSYRPPAGGI